MKKILFISNYYYPYISGMTEYIRLLAEELAKNYEVTVLSSNHDKLAKEEVINGVKVIRAPIICKISKGTVSYKFIKLARELSKDADIVNLHLPMLESGLLSFLIDNKKLVTTYHCDLNLPNSILNNIIRRVMDCSNNICISKSKVMINTSLDYAENSRVAKKYIHKAIGVGAPIKKLNKTEVKRDDIKNIGFCGRIVEEKGIDVLLEAYELLCEKRNDIRLIIGGDYLNVAGGSIYDRLKKYIDDHHIRNVQFIGKIKESEMSKFYSSLDVFVLPSINSLEAFGMVQVEAMLCGTPVVASNLPGVRTIVQKTGMGIISKVKDANDLSRCINEVIDNKDKYIKEKDFIETMYSLKVVVEKHIECFEEIINENKKYN